MCEDTGSGSGSRRSDAYVEGAQKLTRDEQLLKKRKRNKDAQVRKIDSEKNLGNRILYNETPYSDEESKTEKVQAKQSGKSKSFSKIFSDEDEITILEGAIKFKKESELDPRKNMVKFYDFINESLSFPATRIQLSEKVRRFNEKYVKHLHCGTTPKTPHELKLFNLCHKIWVQVSEPHNLGEHNLGEQHEVSEQSEHQNMSETAQLKQPNIIPKSIKPENGMDLQALFDLRKRLIEDLQLILNVMTRSHDNSKQGSLKQCDLYAQSLRLLAKFQSFVVEKAKSPEMHHSPKLLEQEVLRAYFEAKLEHTQLISNAYTAFIKDHGAAP